MALPAPSDDSFMTGDAVRVRGSPPDSPPRATGCGQNRASPGLRSVRFRDARAGMRRCRRGSPAMRAQMPRADDSGSPAAPDGCRGMSAASSLACDPGTLASSREWMISVGHCTLCATSDTSISANSGEDQPADPLRPANGISNRHGTTLGHTEVRHPIGGLEQRLARSDGGVGDPGRVGCIGEPDGLALPDRSRLGDTRFAGVPSNDCPHELVTASMRSADHALAGTAVADGQAGSSQRGGERALADEPVAPHQVEQLVLGHHTIAVLDEMTQQVQCPRLDVDRYARTPQDMTETSTTSPGTGSRARRSRRSGWPPRATLPILVRPD